VTGPRVALAIFLAAGLLAAPLAAEAQPAPPAKVARVVNRKTATQLGLAIPPSVVARADQVVA